jgi:serine protease Do
VIAELKKDGQVERGWLGVQIQPMTPELAQGFGLDEAKGALVAGVEDKGPAARAGLAAGDVVLAWDGKPVERARDLAQLVAATPVGRSVDVKLWRAGKQQTVTVETGKMAQPLAANPAGQGDRGNAAAKVVAGTGLAVADPTAENRARFGLDKSVEGAIVATVEPDGPAGRSGIRPGDVITRVGDVEVDDATAVVAAVDQARKQGRGAVVMMVARGDNERFVALKLAKA